VARPEAEVAEPPIRLEEPARPPVSQSPTATLTASQPRVEDYAAQYLAKEDKTVTITTSMYRWRDEQVDAEMRETELEKWQIVDIGLELYFSEKQRRQAKREDR
jgi:hypothetical protein